MASTFGLVLAGCGDNFRQSADAGSPDAPPGPPRAVIVAGDFMAGHPGVLSTLDPATRTVMKNVGPAMAVGADPILRHYGSELFIINRGENNITILDDQTLAFKEQLGTGADSNPQDVAVVGNKLFVPTYGTKGVTVLTRGSTATTLIDLSADDPDGKPDCESIFLAGGNLYVSCELLDPQNQFKPRGPGKVYIIDAATSTLKPGLTVTLTHKNPFGLFEQIPANMAHGGDLLIPTVEDFATAPGCVERVATGATPAAGGCVLDNTMLGGYATRIGFEVGGGVELMWTAAAATDFLHANLFAYDVAASALWPAPINPSNEVIADLAHCPSGELVIVDSTLNANGLRIYTSATEQTTAPLPIGLGSFSQHGLVCY